MEWRPIYCEHQPQKMTRKLLEEFSLKHRKECVVCLIDVKKSSSPVYADTIKGKETFYIRVGNTTRILTGAEMVKYAKDHF
jgi:predicted HTH transcriptional regulator